MQAVSNKSESRSRSKQTNSRRKAMPPQTPDHGSTADGSAKDTSAVFSSPANRRAGTVEYINQTINRKGKGFIQTGKARRNKFPGEYFTPVSGTLDTSKIWRKQNPRSQAKLRKEYMKAHI